MRADKQDLVEKVKESYSSASYVFFMEYKGLNAKATNEMRNSLRIDGTRVVVMKNTLNSIASAKTKFESAANGLQGQVVTIFASGDPINTAKALHKVSKESDSFRFVAYSDGEQVYKSDSDLGVLASTPTLEVSRSQILGLLTSAPSQIARCLKANSEQIARLISKKSE